MYLQLSCSKPFDTILASLRFVNHVFLTVLVCSENKRDLRFLELTKVGNLCKVEHLFINDRLAAG